jgi:hypothetical protein
MTLKRKAPAKSGDPSPSKRQKLDSDSTHPCQLCTSTSRANIVTIHIRVTGASKGKQLDALTGHEKCIEIIPELNWVKGSDTAKICAANLPSYRTRFRLVRVRVHSLQTISMRSHLPSLSRNATFALNPMAPKSNAPSTSVFNPSTSTVQQPARTWCSTQRLTPMVYIRGSSCALDTTDCASNPRPRQVQYPLDAPRQHVPPPAPKQRDQVRIMMVDWSH